MKQHAITICGLPYTVYEREPNGANDPNYGKHDGKQLSIFIEASMPVAAKEATLIHEWMHAVYEVNGVAHEEQHVSVMAAELYRCGFRVKAGGLFTEGRKG
jgi:hypothetical protein